MTSYDEVLYPSRYFPQTHPDRLATIATLFGMTPAPVERCRVIELGCGSGSNLLPMAYELPKSTFVGLDLAARPIEAGQAAAAALGLENLTLISKDLMAVSADFGAFDYIIAHGVYSWVPLDVRDQVLALCNALLAPHGVAFVSYAIYPGAYVPQMTREMMRFHMLKFKGAQQQITQARSMLRFLLDAQPADTQYRTLLESTRARIMTYPDEYLYHDDLSETYAPCYFHQFIEHGGRHGLQYLADADLVEMHPVQFGPHVAEALDTMGDDMVLREQYLDFLKGRKFRQTLLCREAVALERAVAPERVQGCCVRAPVQAMPPEAEAPAPAMQKFEGFPGAFAETDEPLQQAALRYLGARWPHYVSFEELLAQARSHTDVPPAEAGSATQDARIQDARALGTMLYTLYTLNFLRLHVHACSFVTEASAYPVASPIARWQIRQGAYVTTEFYESVRISDEAVRALLPLLDGSRDRAALVDVLAAQVEAGILSLERAEGQEEDTQPTTALLADGVDKALAAMARFGLLIA